MMVMRTLETKTNRPGPLRRRQCAVLRQESICTHTASLVRRVGSELRVKGVFRETLCFWVANAVVVGVDLSLALKTCGPGCYL